jgi:hypothetical protein
MRVIHTVPSADRAFRRAVEAVVDDPRDQDLDEIRERLRPLFPRIAVFERGLSGEQRGVYAYREGRYRAEPTDPWWAGPTVAHARVSLRTGRLVSVERPVGVAGCTIDELVGRSFSEFVAPSARSIANALFDLVAHGEVRSRAKLERPDGTSVEIEFRAVRDGTDIDVAYRPAPPQLDAWGDRAGLVTAREARSRARAARRAVNAARPPPLRTRSRRSRTPPGPNLPDG